MAQLNCQPCCQPWMDQWGNPQHGSNMSLNMPQGYPMNPMWMGTWHGPPPSGYPYPMPHAHHDPRSYHSRPASPTHSVRSRKSTLSRKSRKKFREVEDSDEEDFDDRRSIRSERKSLGGKRFVERQVPLRDAASMPRELMRRNTIDRVERVDRGDRVERGSAARSRRSVRESSSESEDDDYGSDSQKESEVLEEENDSPYDNNVEDTKDEVKTEVPEASWECEHCTFVNEPGTRVCLVCCKTPTADAKVVTNKPPEKASKHAKSSIKRELSPKPKSKDAKLQRSASSDDYSKDYSETESVLNKLGKLKMTENIKTPEVKKIEEKATTEIKKGRTSRKISFWPGTKFTSFQK